MAVGDNPVTLHLNKSQTTLISGSNGSGKSAIGVESLTFALFGKSFRGMNKPSLINTVNQRGCRVELTFTKNQDRYLVIRGMKPSVFEIYKNDSKLNESSSTKDFQVILEDILGLSFSEFTKTIVLGNANYKPFLQLSAYDRRVFIENILGLTVFTTMNKSLKIRQNINKERIYELSKKHDILLENYREKSEFLKHVTESERTRSEKSEQRIKQLCEEKKNCEEEIDSLTTSIVSISNKTVQDMREESNEISEQKNKIQNSISELDFISKKEQKNLMFFKHPDSAKCPTCFQKISEEFRNKTLDVTTKIIEEAQNKKKEKQSILTELKNKQENIEDTIETIERTTNKINILRRQQELLEKHIEQAKNQHEEESDIEKLKQLEAQIQQLVGQIKEEYSLLEEEKSKRNILDAAAELLKDSGIKSAVLKKYIPMINSYINHYLEVLDFGVHCTLDEQFNDTMKGRFANEFTYTNLSQGERTRIDLAILFALRKVSQVCSGTSYNVLFLDELADSSLDGDGVDALFTIIEEACKNQNVFIVSHRSDMQEKCRSHVKLEKVNGFTRIL